MGPYSGPNQRFGDDVGRDAMFLLIVVIVAIFGFVVAPRLGFALARAPRPRAAGVLPWFAAALFVVAWRLPSPVIGESHTFVQHAVGGGAACAVLSTFVALNAGLRSPVLRVGLAYAVAASLGVAVEIAELGFDELWGTNLTADSALDLLANTIGALSAAAAVEAVLFVRRPRSVPIPNT